MRNVLHGYIALLTVLVLFVFSLSLSTAVAYFSIDEMQGALALAEGEAARVFTDGCAEDALLQASRSMDYSGGSFSYPQGVCMVDVSKEGTVWTFEIQGNRHGYERRLHIEIEITAPLNLKSWQEV